ncbi:MAG: preprotein translocase subunit SecY [Armatimonadota bacterium]
MPSHDLNWKDSLNRLSKALQVPDLRRRLLFIAGMFSLYVLGLHIPAPFVNPEKAADLLSTGVFGMLDIIAGGALKRLSILALGIVPYINASIIMQLLGIAVPSIQRMQKEGESGRKILSMYTRVGTVALAVLQGAGFAIFLKTKGAISDEWGMFSIVPLVIVMAAGTSFLMWMGEQLTDKGIGNGVSLIIFAGIMIRLPYTFGEILQMAWVRTNENFAFALVRVGIIIIIFLLIVVFITWFHQATRKIPIQHAKRVVGNRTFSSANTFLPLKVVTAGVIPIIFAISVVYLPATVAGMLQGQYPEGAQPRWLEILQWFSPGYHWLGAVAYFLLVIFFTYFYTAVVYNVSDIADNLKKHGSFVPGLRPGKQTEQYVDQVLTRITFAGAIFLGLVALLPYIVPFILGGGRGGGSEAALFPLWGGTSLLIVVGVALETMNQMEAHLTIRHYEGFIKR